MKSAVSDILPSTVRTSLTKLGEDITLARKKRAYTVAMMAERLGISKSTYQRLERGDPTVAMGAYAMALFVLGFDAALRDAADPSKDEQGLLLDAARLPKRIRPRRVAR
jgi:transcriptional regulator with XRE-family HTH domain